VFKRLQAGTLSVNEIAEGLGVTRPAVSQHLKILKEARLVIDRPEGTRRLYAIDARGLGELRNWLDGFWEKTLGAFQRAAELEAKRERKRR
jgi:DNA-binding transcriptional ArsR family regulator